MLRADVIVETGRGPTAGDIERAVDAALQDATAWLKEDMRPNVGAHPTPYRRGHLYASYKGIKVAPGIWEYGNDPEEAPYGIYVELGTSRMRARPHLTPAAEALRPLLPDMIRTRLEEVL